jgi:hypothetical protein
MNEEIQTSEEETEQTEVVTPATSETTETETPIEETPEVEVTEQQPQQEPAQPDYKNKFVESQREAILQNERLKQKDAHISKLTTKDTPTDDEMRSLHPEWDQLDDYNKRVLTQIRQADKRAIAAEERATALERKREFEDSLVDFVESPPPEFKALKGKESDFKRFAQRKANIGLPLDTLAKAYLFDIQDEIQTPHTPTLTPGLERGSGGPRSAPKPKKISAEEGREIRKTNFEEWRRLVKAGQIEEDI